MIRVNRLINDADFTIIAAAIRKRDLKRQHADPGHPYEMALAFCMKRACRFLRAHGQHMLKTHIVVAKRGKREDDDLELAFHRIRSGTDFEEEMSGFEIVFAYKKTNSAGLQFADLTARPIGRYVLDPTQRNRARDIIEPKLRRSPGGMVEGWGLKSFP